MKTALLLSLLALPVHAEIRAAARTGIFVGGESNPAGTVEVDARFGNWSVAPAYEVIQGGYGLHSVHVNVRRLFRAGDNTFWIGAGPTRVSSTYGTETTWNVDAAYGRRMGAWEPFVAARYYSYDIEVFRDTLVANGAVISVGISRKLW